jgi:sulfonate transport system substrate-binding protein
MLTTGEESGKIRRIASANSVRPSMIFLVAPTKILDDPAARPRIADFIARVTRSYQWQSDNFDAAVPIIAKFYKVSPGDARIILGRSLIHFAPIDDQVIADQQVEADAFLRIGLIKAKLNVGDIFDRSFNDVVTQSAAAGKDVP